jgi:hypothetical protein
MQRQKILALFTAVLGVIACADHSAVAENYLTSRPYLPVTLTVQSDNQGALPEFALTDNPAAYRAYIQATPNERYRLRVSNTSDQRVGLVIAVDGRNIISGQKSDLKNTERMYILNPHESADYEGWRSGKNQTNRFYFTNTADSYAAAWGDTSAMGVIAMAVYPERYQVMPMREERSVNGLASKSRAASPAPAADAQAGTGYGETTYSPTVTVTFEPSSEASQKVFFKYEWRETLCQKKILPECSYQYRQEQDNRFWQNDNQGYAPPPPR